ncbi:voltage-gated potassium channel [Guyanagaster necrorhizus]|uniref:Voltage-gated potassium channel n=1 Tax=Guyanagaster necrorhizus TaxID=856835 RepID=A0A9P7VLV9_9AGAR|nr:voltage-gated potassium channel [Guyanagaster necrorhizus MCA 3950]KAG7442346.1 voltage-gated potassium channel [Guyanagaster necrorhizus MCA 3950]
MDDSVNGPIQETSMTTTNTLHDEYSREKDAELIKKTLKLDEEGTKDFFKPAVLRWWFASVGVPMIAGTFGPVANLMSICALVQPWRVMIPPSETEGNGVPISDPAWLLVLNSVSLGCSLAANLFLSFNFARKVRYAIAQPLTIILWYLSAVFLLVPLSLTKILTIKPTYNHAFSQPYYYALIATVLYILISSLLVVNVIGAYKFRFYAPSFATLTMPQRTLMLQAIGFSFYLAMGAGLFSAIEDWEFVNGLYWADYTLLTIGIGSDYPLTTQLGRGLMIPYAVGGIMMVGLIVGRVQDLMLERGRAKIERKALKSQRRRWFKKSNKKQEEEDFKTMRKIERRADMMRKYLALAASSVAFFFLWLMGALVFRFTEAPQHWTYFDAMYFSYTTLLTVGYGDLYPKSNSGKPFFVIWTLIAVPTMTILISNLSDTIVGWLEMGTIWLGHYTILPDRKTMKEMNESSDSVDARELKLDVEMLGNIIAQEEEKRGMHRGTTLAKAIKRVVRDTGRKTPKKYSWEDWQFFLALLEMPQSERESFWLADEGPLFSDVSESTWLLWKLCGKLENVMDQEFRDLENGVQADKEE